MTEQLVHPDRDKSNISSRPPPEASSRTISNSQKKSNIFSILITRSRTFVFPPTPRDDPASKDKRWLSLRRFRSQNEQSTTDRRASASARSEPALTTVPIEEQGPAEGNQNNERSRVDIQLPIDGASTQEPVDQRRVDHLDEFEQQQDFFIAKKMEVPEQLNKEWEQVVLPNLLRDRSTFGASLGLKTHEINGREELCMAGSKPSPTEMKPTLIITFRNESFKKKFGQDMRRYDYVEKLGVEKKMILEKGEAGTKKTIFPRWAASNYEGAGRSDLKLPVRLISCEEQISEYESACGLRLKFVVDFGESQMTHYSTLGGLIMLGDKVYGLTTGHSIVVSDAGNSDHVQETNSFGRSSLVFQDSDIMGPPNTLSWRRISCYPTFVFAGQRFTTTDLQSPVWDDKHTSSDWLLVNIDDSDLKENSYQDSNGDQVAISEVLPLSRLVPGPVLVQSGQEPARPGFLSQNSSVLHTDKSAFRVRQIVMQEPIVLGASGSWVVRGSQLCGYIVAIQEGSPTAYMLPIGDVFAEIASATGTHPVRLMSKSDIQTFTRQKRPTQASIFNSQLPPMGGSNDVITSQRLPAPLNDVPKPQYQPTPATIRPTLPAESISIRTRLRNLPDALRPHLRRSRFNVTPKARRSSTRPVPEQSLLWPVLAILFPSLYETKFSDRICIRLLSLALHSASWMFFILLTQSLVLILIALGPAILENIYLISLSYNSNPHTLTSSQINSTFISGIANITRFARLEVRVGYFSVCVKNTTEASTCGGFLPKSSGSEQDPLDLVSIGTQYQDVGRLLFLIATSLSIIPPLLLLRQFIIPVGKQVYFHKKAPFELSLRPRSSSPSSRWSILRCPPPPLKTLAHRVFLPIITYGIVNAAVICHLVVSVCLLMLVSLRTFTAVGSTITLRTFSGGAVKAQLGGLATGLGWLAVALGIVLFWGLKSAYRVARIYVDSLERRNETIELHERLDSELYTGLDSLGNF